MTLFIPGHSPPHVTMPARVCRGSKKSLDRGPATSNSSSSGDGAPGKRAMCAGIRASSLTARRSGEGNLASPRTVTFTPSPSPYGESAPDQDRGGPSEVALVSLDGELAKVFGEKRGSVPIDRQRKPRTLREQRTHPIEWNAQNPAQLPSERVHGAGPIVKEGHLTKSLPGPQGREHHLGPRLDDLHRAHRDVKEGVDWVAGPVHAIAGQVVLSLRDRRQGGE